MMTRGFVPVVLALGVAASPALAGERHRGMNVSIHSDGPIESCAQMHITFDHVDAARAEETFTISAPRGALKMRANSNSGIYVYGAARSDFAVTACKAAADPQDLARIAVSAENGDLQASGPDGRD